PARELVLEAEAFAARGVRALAALGIEAEVSGRERTVGQHARGVRRHERGLAEDKLRALEVARAVRPRVERVAVLRVVIVLVADAAEPGRAVAFVPRILEAEVRVLIDDEPAPGQVAQAVLDTAVRKCRR